MAEDDVDGINTQPDMFSASAEVLCVRMHPVARTEVSSDLSHPDQSRDHDAE